MTSIVAADLGKPPLANGKVAVHTITRLPERRHVMLPASIAQTINLPAMSQITPTRPKRKAQFTQSYRENDEDEAQGAGRDEDFGPITEPEPPSTPSPFKTKRVPESPSTSPGKPQGTPRSKPIPKPPPTDPSTWRASQVPVRRKVRR